MHFLAGLREFLSALDDSIVKVVSFSTQISPDLPPVDTLNGVLLLKSGRSGTISFSYGTEFKTDFFIEVVSSKGSVSMTPTGVKVAELNTSSGVHEEFNKIFSPDTGVGFEIEAFAKAIPNKVSDERQTAEEALIDLMLIEKLLQSGEQGGVLMSI